MTQVSGEGVDWGTVNSIAKDGVGATPSDIDGIVRAMTNDKRQMAEYCGSSHLCRHGR